MAEKLARAEGTFGGCFGCGSENPVGLKLSFERNGDVVVSSTTLGLEYAGYEDFAHGGVVAALLDEAMGWAMLTLAGRYGVTRGLTVRYRRPVRINRPIRVRARVLEANGATVFLESCVEDERGRMLARGEGEWVVVRHERAVSRRA